MRDKNRSIVQTPLNTHDQFAPPVSDTNIGIEQDFYANLRIKGAVLLHYYTAGKLERQAKQEST